MRRAAEIIARPTPAGLLVCAPAYLGQCQYGQAGAILTPLDLLIFARKAAQQGGRFVIEIQGDGGSLFPLELSAEWAGGGA